MVRLITILCCFALGLALKAEERLLLADYHGEAKILQNYALAIATYYNATGGMPKSLADIRDTDIRDNTILTVDFGSRHAATVPSRYMLLETPLALGTGEKVTMISVDYFVTAGDIRENRMGGRMAALLKVNGMGGSMLVPASEIDPLLKAAGVAWKPIGGEVPLPTFPLTPRKREMSETMKRALEMRARGELPIPKRTDKETWRDQKTPDAKPVEVPSLPSAPTSQTKQPANPVRWIVGLIIVAGGAVFLMRKKKPKL